MNSAAHATRVCTGTQCLANATHAPDIVAGRLTSFDCVMLTFWYYLVTGVRMNVHALSRCVVGAITGLAFLFLPGAAVANCANGSTTQAVSAGQNLTQIIESSDAPCTLNVGPGTYDATPTAWTGDSIFRISSGITVRSVSGATSTTLRVPAGTQWATLNIQPLNGRCPSGATLDGFTLTGGVWGAYVGWANQPGCPANLISNVTLRNLIINTSYYGPPGGHGIDFVGVQNSVIDSCTINSAGANGIFLEGGDQNNLVMNNTIQSTVTQHAIAIQGSSNNVIVGNTINGSGFDGILLNSSSGPSLSTPGSSNNRIERNVINGHRTDGITMTDASGFNYVGLNTAHSGSYDPVTKPSPNPTTGTGIWVNNASHGNYLFGNDLSGSPENGIDVLASNSTYLQGNNVHGNLQGGIWIANWGPAPPQDTVVHNNFVYFNTSNAQVHLAGASNVDVAYNYLSGAQSPQSSTLASSNTGGVLIQETGAPAVGSNSIMLYENSVTDVNNRVLVNATTTNALVFRNRFLNGSNDPSAPSGRQGLTYSIAPAGVQWDASRFFGGNYWSEFNAAAGDPDPAHPYTGFVYNGTSGIDGRGPYVDKFPYRSESLPTSYATYSVSALEPLAGAVVAGGTKKTVHWIARGCVLVDIYYGSGAGTALVASRYPNVGYYFWTVPTTLPFRTDYFVRIVCLTSQGAPAGASDDTGHFSVTNSDLVLLNPGRAFRAVNGGTIRVAWKKSGAVTGVNVFVRAASGSESQVATNAQGTFVDVTLPGNVSNSNQITIRIQDPATGSRGDSVDGSFMVRGATPAITTALGGETLQMGAIQTIEWYGPSNSMLVDLDLYENGAFSRSIVKNLSDFGSFTWLVPEMWSTASKVRATFKDAAGVALSAADSGTFRVQYAITPGALITRYRLYSPVTLEHLFTTDSNEYAVLGQTGVWAQEGAASRIHNGPTNIGGVEAVPYYRVYDFLSRWHHWTTDRNEYFVLRQISARYAAEGVEGYVFLSQVPGSVAWYRLAYPPVPGLHHWTRDVNERNVLVTQRGWVEEDHVYVIP